MTHYAEEFKASIIARMLPPNDVPVPQLARETGIPKDTLYTWRSKHRKAVGDVTVQPPASGELSSEEKFAVVIESASLNEVELSEYCRRKGLYPTQISAWTNACTQANASQTPKLDRTQLKAQVKHIKQLEAELRRKDKALAEAAALLVLQKKVRALWGEPEDGESS
jgi:transposase-like protein